MQQLERRGGPGSHLHVEVLLGVFYVPLNFTVDVKVKLLGHWQRDQRRPPWVGFLTVAGKKHKDLKRFKMSVAQVHFIHIFKNRGA